MDEKGAFHKPFVLPQEDPSFYGFWLNTYNVPELMQAPVTIKERELVRALDEPRRVLTPQGPAAPPSAGSSSGREQPSRSPIRE